MAARFLDRDRGLTRLRLIAMAVFGVIVGVIVSAVTDGVYGLVAGWAAASAFYVAWVWLVVGRLDAAKTKAHATREDPGSAISEFLVLAASVASLGGVALLLIRAHTVHGAVQGAVAGLAVFSVALSWLLIHTLYMLRYARVYYSHPIGGIDFNNPDESPRYVDFAYLSFDLGMTYQVSDTSLRTSQLRSIVLRHTLLSYVFGAVVLATTINLIANLGA
jgi:Predicted membrane protein